MKKRTVVSLSAAGAAGAVAAVLPLFVNPPKPFAPAADGSCWMASLPDDMPLSQVVLPGTHDSATEKIFFASIARCQHLTIPQQLEAGCRFLDLRLRMRNSQLIAVHGVTPCYQVSGGRAVAYTFDQIVDSIYAFLRRNPSETVLVSVKNEGKEDNAAFFRYLRQYIERCPHRWYTENRVPAVGEARGKMVLLRRFSLQGVSADDGSSGLNLQPALWGNMGGRKTTGYKKFHMTLQNGEHGSGVCLQDCYSLGVRKKWFFGIKPLLDRGRYHNELLLNFFSCTGRLFPVAAALPLNRLYQTYESQAVKNGGILIFDFLNARLAARVYRENPAVPRKVPDAAEPSNEKVPLLARYLSGYCNLLYRIFD